LVFWALYSSYHYPSHQYPDLPDCLHDSWVNNLPTMLVNCVLYCKVEIKYSRVLLCDSSFYEDSLLRPLPSRTEHSQLVVHHCHNSSVLSLRNALLTLFWCACVFFFKYIFYFFYFIAVLLNWLWFFHPWCPSKRQKRRKNQNTWRYILSWCLLNHGLGRLQQN